jgi:broad specificity phosphatase PhoE
VTIVRYLTHPQVKIDAAVPVPRWGLSDIGRSRVEALATAGTLAGTTAIISSGETKAIETAEILAQALGIIVEVREAMHENDRSSTGFLPPPAFEAMADRFFANPTDSIDGWERAIDAQARIVGEVERVLSRSFTGDVLFVGHGAVGSLLLCHYAHLLINRVHDQPAGGGNIFSLAQIGRQVSSRWCPMEAYAASVSQRKQF